MDLVQLTTSGLTVIMLAWAVRSANALIKRVDALEVTVGHLVGIAEGNEDYSDYSDEEEEEADDLER